MDPPTPQCTNRAVGAGGSISGLRTGEPDAGGDAAFVRSPAPSGTVSRETPGRRAGVEPGPPPPNASADATVSSSSFARPIGFERCVSYAFSKS